MAANIGGRLIGTSFAAVTATLAAQDWVPGQGPSKIAAVAACVAGFLCVMSIILLFFLPEGEYKEDHAKPSA